MSADLVFVNGVVLTMERERPVAEALAVAGRRIVAVGSLSDVERHRGPATRVVDLAGRALLPGFVDAHTHFVQYGLRLMRLDLSAAASREDVIESVRERAQMTPAEGWVVGHSWDESKWDARERPTREDLDRAGGGRAVILSRVDRHMGVLSTEGLRRAGFDASQHADGALLEADYNRATEAVSPAIETLAKGVRQATRAAHALGVTSAHVMASIDDFRALQLARETGGLGVRTTLYFHVGAVETALAAGWRRGLGDDWIRVNGIKLYGDGSIGARTARVSFGYLPEPREGTRTAPAGGVGEGSREKGSLTYEDKTLHDLASRAHHAGLQIAIHAIGDEAIGQAVGAIEAALAEKPAGNARHRVEHLELFSDEHARRMREAGIVASAQPNFVGEWGHPGQMYAARLGDDVVPKHNRFAVLSRERVLVAFGSDDMPLGPLYGLHCAVNGPAADQRLTVEDALRAYTLDAARAGFAEGAVGSLAVGKLADLVVLSEDPRAAAGRLRELAVEMTVVDGRVVVDLL